MLRTSRGLMLALSLLAGGACTDPDSVSGSGFQRGIDADISATRDAGAPTTRNLGSQSGVVFGFGHSN